MIVCGTNVWIANENIGGILVVNKISGIVEQIIQVPKIEYQKEVVERQVEQVVNVQKTVEAPRAQERALQQPAK